MERTTASLFTGGGGFEVGALVAGHKPVWGVEIRADIAAVAEANIPGLRVIVSDVAAVDYSTLERPDHLHASPSCKNASTASDGEEAFEDMSSAQAIRACILAQRPVVVSLENVWQYRNFDSFKLILKTLSECGYCVKYWHLNSADYGVPQTRKRLILIARLDKEPIKPPATHYKPDAKKALRGMRSMFWKPWVGWFSAIEDLIPGLPPTEPAPWQLARLPKEFKSMLLAQGSFDGEVVNRDDTEPAFTVTANSNQGGLKAFLMPGGGNTNFGEAKPGNGQNANKGKIHRSDREHRFTVTDQGKGASRAFVVGSQYAQPASVKDREVQVRAEDEPYFTVTVAGGQNSDQRIYAGHWVSITPRCLARFQSFPDSYILPDANGLACEVIGNAVPPLLAEAICRSLR